MLDTNCRDLNFITSILHCHCRKWKRWFLSYYLSQSSSKKKNLWHQRRLDWYDVATAYATILASWDVEARFIAVSATQSGSTNDINAWQDTKLYEALEIDNLLPPKDLFIGDEAFTNTFQLLTSWSNRGFDQYNDSYSFNFWLSHSRQCMECSFGMLTQRWGIFWWPFCFAFDQWPFMVLVPMKLHNLCIDQNDKTSILHFNKEIMSNDQWVVYDNYCHDDTPLWDQSLGDRLRDIALKLEQLGILRPPHASNSHCK